MFGLGVENILLNWSNNMVHISVLLSVNMWVPGCKKGPIAFVHMLNFLAPEKEVGITFNPSHSKGLSIKFFLGVAIINRLLYGHNFSGK